MPISKWISVIVFMEWMKTMMDDRFSVGSWIIMLFSAGRVHNNDLILLPLMSLLPMCIVNYTSLVQVFWESTCLKCVEKDSVI